VIIDCTGTENQNQDNKHITAKHEYSKTHKKTRNCDHCRAAAKPAASANSLGLSGSNLACDSRPVVYANRLNVIWIGVLLSQHNIEATLRYHNLCIHSQTSQSSVISSQFQTNINISTFNNKSSSKSFG